MGEESRRKRRWDQPDESLISSIPEIFPGTNVGSFLINPLTANVIQAPILQQQAAAVIRKLTQPKPQDELIIAREIVINDAEATVRYKLTRRQTQEEIQKCTGAVVIIRGKYRPPNVMPDGDKPLYLHISAGAHLKETAEKIIAVDRAAALVEEMMKPTSKAFNTSVYLGFDADPSMNIATRIRGPNDQYINHIMNETGVTVLLRGRGSGHAGSANLEEGEQPLHLFLSSNSTKSLEDARLLVENLLDTISREFGIVRVAAAKVYAAVPPPQNLLTGVECSRVDANSSLTSSPSLSGHSQPNGISYSHPSLGSSTLYSGYGGIYPQATPLQQVALALRQTSVISSAIAPAISTANTATSTSVSTSSVNDKRPPQKRKFKELPAVSIQVPEDPGNEALMPPSHKKLAGFPSNGIPSLLQAKDKPPPVPKFSSTPPPKFNSTTPSKSMPPPPPKIISTASAHKGVSSTDVGSSKSKLEIVPDTLVKLMEYGEDDDDDDDF